jgi:RAB6A-GEF complex partner protein 2
VNNGAVSPSLFFFPMRLIERMADTYTVMLPANLPPTYKGRGMKFGYELVVGTCRAGSVYPQQSSTRFAKSQVSKGGVSRVMKVPIRVYNHVSGKEKPSYFRVLVLIFFFSGNGDGDV